jgi:hypothetical protein
VSKSTSGLSLLNAQGNREQLAIKKAARNLDWQARYDESHKLNDRILNITKMRPAKKLVDVP